MPPANSMPPGNRPRCGARKRDGSLCQQYPIKGTSRCRSHPGIPLAKAKAKGAVVEELRRWGLGDATVDPGVTLLRLVSQSAARVELYSMLLQRAYEAAERLQAAHEAQGLVAVPGSPVSCQDGDDGPEDAAIQTARADLARVFATGGVSALIGHTYDATKTGEVYATQEAIRGLAKLEADERDRCASFAAKAVAAGIAERQVRIAERQAGVLAEVIRLVLSGLPVSDQVRAAALASIPQHIQTVTGVKVIEGGTA